VEVRGGEERLHLDETRQRLGCWEMGRGEPEPEEGEVAQDKVNLPSRDPVMADSSHRGDIYRA
jgi:hypothetical protein